MALRYRDLQAPASLPTGDLSSGGAEATERMAEAFRTFGDITTDLYAKHRAQKGAQEGSEAGAAGKPELRTGFKAMTAYGAAYNNAAEATYATKLELDSDEAMRRIERESEANLPGYQAGAKAWMDETLKAVPQQLRPRASQMLQARYNAGLTRVTLQAEAKEEDTALAAHLEALPELERSTLATLASLPEGDADAELARVVGEHRAKVAALSGLTEVQKVKLHAAFIDALDSGLANQKITDTVTDMMSLTRRDVLKADKAVAAYSARTDLDPEEQQQALSEYMQQRSQWERIQSGVHAEATVALSRRLAGGAFGGDVVSEARRLYRAGAISVDELEGYENTEVRNQKSHADSTALSESIREALVAGAPLEPWNNKHRVGVDTLFTTEVEQRGYEPGDPRYQDLALQLVKRSQILPDTAVSWASRALMSGNEEQSLAAAKFMDRARFAAPRAFEYNDDHYPAVFGEMLLSNVNAGVPFERAYELTERATDPTNKALQEHRDEQYKELEKGGLAKVRKTNQRELAKALGVDSDEVTQPALVEYEQNVRRFYRDSGDIDIARKIAGQYARSWGLTNVNGKLELVKYPLEGIGLDPLSVKTDIANLLKAEGVDLDIDKIQLQPNRNTDYTKGRKWTLVAPDEYGVLDTVRGARNQPLGYSVPTTSAEFDTQVAGRSEYLRQQAETRKKAYLKYQEQIDEAMVLSGAADRR